MWPFGGSTGGGGGGGCCTDSVIGRVVITPTLVGAVSSPVASENVVVLFG